ncbi:MAG: thioredoxin-like domain-containing protein [Planctomycetaceae bacterium]
MRVSLPLTAGLIPLAMLILTACPLMAQDSETESAEAEVTEKVVAKPPVPANPFPDAVAVPVGILDGGHGWLNTSTPITLKDLRGKVVLIDFWTYCCINCMHVLPDLKYLEEKYPNELVVIGVHSAKFENEKQADSIREAILRYGIRHPVINDSDLTIWRKFGVRSWPTLALIDPTGRYVGARSGEGSREMFDQIIEKLVEYHRARGTLDEQPLVFDLESGRAEPTALRYPGKILADEASSRLFISDSSHNRIVVTDMAGTVQEVIGSGQQGRTDGSFSDASFDHPQGMALADDVLYVADTENHLLRQVSLSEKTVTTLAGTGRQGPPAGKGGSLLKTDLNSPWDLLIVDHTLYIAMAGPHQIWAHRMGSQRIDVFAGNGREDVINGTAERSSFAQPSGLAVNSDRSILYVADSEGSAVRQVRLALPVRVATLAGTSELPRGESLFAFGDTDGQGARARFQHPLGVAFHDHALYVADAYNHKIRKVDVNSGDVTTWMGTGLAGKSIRDDGAELNEPAGLAVANGTLFIADTNNHRILKVSLDSKQASELTISGLQPPVMQTGDRSSSSWENAASLPDVTIIPDQPLNVTVLLKVPDGHQLNSLAPVTWEVVTLDGDSICADDAVGRDEAVVEGDAAAFQVPLSGVVGTATLGLRMSFGYCSTESGKLCRLATGEWKVSVTTAADSEPGQLNLTFAAPEPMSLPDAGKGN